MQLTGAEIVITAETGFEEEKALKKLKEFDTVCDDKNYKKNTNT